MSKNENSTEGKLDAVYPELARRWRLVAEKMWNEHKLMIRVTEGLRDYKDQLAIWNKGRQKDKSGKWFISEPKKVVTFAMPGQSYHQYGLAIDICFQGSDPYLEKIDKKDAEFLWSEYGRFCKEVGLEWGGVWKGKKNDRPHCQLSLGLSIQTLQSLLENGGIESVWKKCEALACCGSVLV